MNSETTKNIGIVVFTLALAFAVVSCGKKSDREQAANVGVGERAGIAADTAASNTMEAARQAAEAAKNASDKAVKKTGEALEDAGEAMEEAVENLQK